MDTAGKCLEIWVVGADDGTAVVRHQLMETDEMAAIEGKYNPRFAGRERQMVWTDRPYRFRMW